VRRLYNKHFGTLVVAIDRFVTTDIAHRNGIFSRSDFLTRVYSNFLASYERDFAIFGVPGQRPTSELEEEKRERQEVYAMVKREFGSIEGLTKYMKALRDLNEQWESLRVKVLESKKEEEEEKEQKQEREQK
jgi:hypothetical protein